MKTPVLTSNGEKLSLWLQDQMNSGKFTNNDLVHFIELTGAYLNLKTIPNYQKAHKMSYNGVKNNREIAEIFDVKFVIDNQ